MADSTRPKMKLYWYPFYRSVRNIWLIREMGVEDDFEFIRLKPKEDTAADTAYKKDVHPHGTIPGLVVPGESPILESGAICMYLAYKYDKCLPEPKDMAEYINTIMYTNVTLDELFGFFYYYWVLKTRGNEEMAEEKRAKLNAALDYLTERLGDKEFICGDKFTAADCVLGYDLYCGSVFKDGELLKKHTKLQEYFARLQKRPAFQSAANMA